MGEASKLVSGAILGVDSTHVTINGVRYSIAPPTIGRIAGAAYHLSDIKDGKTLKEVIGSINEAANAAKALSFFIIGDTSLYAELSKGTFDEIVTGLEAAYSMISAQNFIRLSALSRSVANLTAKQKL